MTEKYVDIPPDVWVVIDEFARKRRYPSARLEGCRHLRELGCSRRQADGEGEFLRNSCGMIIFERINCVPL